MKARFEAFSDGVFAIAITLLIIEIRPPQDDVPLGPALLALWPSYLAYVASFLSIGIWWMAHHIITHYVERIDGGLMLFNVLLLMTIAFIPFPTALLAERLATNHDAEIAMVFYAVAYFLPALVAGLLLRYMRVRGHFRLEAFEREAPPTIARRGFLGAGLNLLAIVVAFVAPVVALALFIATAAYWGIVTSRWRPSPHPS